MVRVAVLIFLGVCGLVNCKPHEKYTTKYDNVDLDTIIKNDRLLRSYVDCVLGKKTCTKDGEELKKHLPEALQTDCAKCTDSQKNGIKKIVRHLIKNKRSWWDELEAKFDRQRIYRKKYAADLK